MWWIWSKPHIETGDHSTGAYVASINKALQMHEKMFHTDITIVAGDFNSSSAFYRTGKYHNQLVEDLGQKGLTSAYHAFTRDPHGKEKHPTFRHHGARHGKYHIDYCFIPKKWAKRLKKVEIGSVKGWRHLSDHAPIIVDIRL